jgi:hypothetical protein
MSHGPTQNDPEDAIAIRIDDISQLFHTLDPYPFREKDLDKDAEEFIVNWARELPRQQTIRIILYVPSAQSRQPLSAEVPLGIKRHFAHRAEMTGFELKEQLRVGWRSLAIGVSVLTICIVISQTTHSVVPPPLNKVLEESLIIFGWVANWKPIETFLYDWWPIVRRRNLYQRLANAQVELRPTPA